MFACLNSCVQMCVPASPGNVRQWAIRRDDVWIHMALQTHDARTIRTAQCFAETGQRVDVLHPVHHSGQQTRCSAEQLHMYNQAGGLQQSGKPPELTSWIAVTPVPGVTQSCTQLSWSGWKAWMMYASTFLGCPADHTAWDMYFGAYYLKLWIHVSISACMWCRRLGLSQARVELVCPCKETKDLSMSLYHTKKRRERFMACLTFTGAIGRVRGCYFSSWKLACTAGLHANASC